MSGHNVEVQSLRDIHFLSDPQISPKGERVAFVHTTVDYDANDYISNIWLIDFNSGELRPFTRGRGKDQYPRWSPDGSSLLFVSTPRRRKDGEELKRQLYIIGLRGGEAEQMTEVEGGVQDPRWSPSGSRILFTSRVWQDKRPAPGIKPVKRMLYKYNGKGFFHGRRKHLFILSLKSRRTEQITYGSFDVDDGDWIEDEQRVAFISNLDPNADLTGDKYIFSLPVEGGRPERLTDRPRIISSIKTFTKMDEIAYIGHDYRQGLATNHDIWIIPSSGGRSVNITRKFDQDIGKTLISDIRVKTTNTSPQWSDDGASLYFTSAYSGVVGLYKVLREGGGVEMILGGIDHSIEAWSISKDGCIAYTTLQSTAPPELWAEKDGVREQLTNLNRGWVKQHEIRRSEAFTFVSSTGHTVEGWLIKPPNFDWAEKYPMLLEVHGGPRGIYGYSLMHEFQVLAAQGWVVVYTNPYGSGGYWEDFQAGLPGHYGEQDYTDLMEAVDYVLEHYGFIDPQRLGVLGGSYGGFMTNWIVTHTNRFKAAVTMRGISNWLSMFGCSDIGWTFVRREMGGDPPWIDEEAYLAKSPIRYVDKVETPTLIIHSEKDYRCPIEQAEQFFTALKFLGVPTELIRFSDENHDLSREGKPMNREERLSQVIRWFKTHL